MSTLRSERRGSHARPVLPKPLFEICAVRQGSDLAVRLEGELDLYECPKLKRALDNATEGGAETLIVDIRDLTFLDVAGLELLLAESRRWDARGRRLLLTRAQGSVANLFRITAVEQMLTFVNDPAPIDLGAVRAPAFA